MELRIWAAAGTAALLTGIAVAGTGHAADAAPASAGQEFARLDANGDRRLSRDEASRIQDFERAFREADDNRDGALDPDEFAKAQAIHDRMRAEQYLDDSLITAKVKAALLKDLRLKGLDVKVETHRGTVVLTGIVDDVEQARRAAEIAAGIAGVSAVRNSLTIKG